MSTRANIIIKEGKRKLIFYRHSDGYPDGALPTLKKFMQLVKEEKIRDNINQAAGWLILIGAREYDHYIGKVDYMPKADITVPEPNDPMMGWKCGAYEPSTGIQGDIDYLYTLDLKKLTITVQYVGYDRITDKQVFETINTITDFTPDTVEVDPVSVEPEFSADELEIL